MRSPTSRKFSPSLFNRLASWLRTSAVDGLPKRLPFALALSKPAFVRSPIRIRSCFANADSKAMMQSLNTPKVDKYGSLNEWKPTPMLSNCDR